MASPQIMALVTGANKGIGLEIVRQLAAKGARVFLGARDRSAGEKAAASITGDVHFLALDVSDAASIAGAARELARLTDYLDTLVNNAGICLDFNESVLRVSAETAHKSFTTNTLGPLLVTQAFHPLLAKSSAPRVINMSSGAGQLGDGELQSWAPAYSMSKTALNSVTQLLAAALPDFAVNSMCPGWVRTDMGGAGATRSVEQGADTATWLALEAPQNLTGRFFRDREGIPW